MANYLVKSLIIVLAMLAAGAGAFHSWHTRGLYVKAALLSEAFNLTSAVKLRVSDYYVKHGVMPQDNSDADLPPPQSIFGTSVKRVAINRGGVLIVDFEDKIGAMAMTYTPTVSSVSGLLNWNCTSDSIDQSVLNVLKPGCSYLPATNESLLMSAIANKDLAMVDDLLSKGARPNAVVRGNTPLMLAAKIGELSVVERLLDVGAKVDNGSLNSARRTPLMVSISSGHSDVVALLLSHSASVIQKDYRGLTALDHAIATDQRMGGERFELLVSARFNRYFAGRQLNEAEKPVSEQERNLKLLNIYHELRQASRSCHTQRIKSVLLSENDLMVPETIEGKPLGKHIRKPECVLKLTGFVHNKKTYQIAMHAYYAQQVQRCDAKKVETVMRENPGLSVEQLHQGRSHLNRAVRSGCTAAVSLMVRSRGLQGRLPDDVLVTAIQQAPQASLVKLVGSLIEAGANVNGQAAAGQKPLEAAISLEQPVVAKYLVDAGADVNASTFNRSYPVIEASKKGYEHLVLEILAHGANLNASDSMGRTALLAAIGSNRQHLVETLLRAGANTRIRDRNGIDALLLAESRDLGKIKQSLMASAE